MERLSAHDFSGTTLKRPGRWVVCFGADWCGFCRDFRREYYEPLAQRSKIPFGWADVTEFSTPLWELFGLDAVPVLAVFVEGKLVWRRDSELGVGLGAEDAMALGKEIG